MDYNTFIIHFKENQYNALIKEIEIFLKVFRTNKTIKHFIVKILPNI